MSQFVLTVQGLTKKFANFTAVDNFSFNIAAGEIVGLLGPNGAGKTTTIQMLLGLMLPTSGAITYFDLPFEENREQILQRLNYASGYSSFLWRLTVWENLDVFGWLYSVKNHKQKIKELAEIFEVSSFLHKKIIDLSAGQITRAVLVKAFLNDAEVLLLDEPTVALDPDVAVKIRDFILSERKKRNIAILFASHNMSEVEEICDKVIFLHEGKIIATDTPQALARRQKNSKIHLMLKNNHNKLSNIIKRCNFALEMKQNLSIITLPTNDLASFLTEISKEGIEYSEIEIFHPSLEDFFISMSNHHETKL